MRRYRSGAGEAADQVGAQDTQLPSRACGHTEEEIHQHPDPAAERAAKVQRALPVPRRALGRDDGGGEGGVHHHDVGHLPATHPRLPLGPDAAASRGCDQGRPARHRGVELALELLGLEPLLLQAGPRARRRRLQAGRAARCARGDIRAADHPGARAAGGHAAALRGHLPLGQRAPPRHRRLGERLHARVFRRDGGLRRRLRQVHLPLRREPRVRARRLVGRHRLPAAAAAQRRDAQLVIHEAAHTPQQLLPARAGAGLEPLQVYHGGARALALGIRAKGGARGAPALRRAEVR
mmetsp:Transcript_18335/g.39444  ORF Transcript_18335/g.39444 Transcript_18335/m.39444 type:complete len:294 (+) Transcript_18335:642-1523(+)